MSLTFGERVTKRRKQLQMTQEELAFKIGVTQRQVSFYETGKNEPTSKVLTNLADALETSTDWLLGRTEIPERPLRGTGDLDDLETEALKLLRTHDYKTRQKIVNIIKASL